MTKIAINTIETVYLSKVSDEIEADGRHVIEIPDSLWTLYCKARKLEANLMDKIFSGEKQTTGGGTK